MTDSAEHNTPADPSTDEAGASREPDGHGVNALFALAAFIAQHPDLPRIRSIVVHTERVSGPHLADLAEHYGQIPYGQIPQADIQAEYDGVHTTLFMVQQQDDRPL